MVVYAGKMNLYENYTNLYFFSLKNKVSFKILLILKHGFYIFQGLVIDRNGKKLKSLSKVRENKLK